MRFFNRSEESGNGSRKIHMLESDEGSESVKLAGGSFTLSGSLIQRSPVTLPYDVSADVAIAACNGASDAKLALMLMGDEFDRMFRSNSIEGSK